MKKLFNTVALIIILLIGASSVMAAEPVVLSVSNTKGISGELVIAAVSITADSRLGAGTFTISYDGSRLECVSAEEGAAIAGRGIYSINNDEKKSNIILAYVNTDGLENEGEILEMTFKVLDKSAGEIPISLQVSEFKSSEDLLDIPYTMNDGSITVVLQEDEPTAPTPTESSPDDAIPSPTSDQSPSLSTQEETIPESTQDEAVSPNPVTGSSPYIFFLTFFISVVFLITSLAAYLCFNLYKHRLRRKDD